MKDTFLPKKKKKSKHLKPTIQGRPTLNSLLDANIRVLAGESKTEVAKDLHIAPTTLEDRLGRLNEFQNSTLPAIGLDRQIIAEALSEKLKPIKEELSLAALDIVRKTDKLVLEKLNSTPLKDLKLPDLTKTADSYESRLARITGLEQDPTQGSDPKGTASRISVFVENMFASHSDKLKKERDEINSTNNKQTPPPIEAEIVT